MLMSRCTPFCYGRESVSSGHKNLNNEVQKEAQKNSLPALVKSLCTALIYSSPTHTRKKWQTTLVLTLCLREAAGVNMCCTCALLPPYSDWWKWHRGLESVKVSVAADKTHRRCPTMTTISWNQILSKTTWKQLKQFTIVIPHYIPQYLHTRP